jgi:hypothetical protein
VQQLVVQLDSEKGVERFLIPDPDGSFKRDFLKQLAFERLFDDQVEKDAERLVFTGDVILAKARRFCQREVRSIDPRQLKADVIATPLLREVGTDDYAFAHLTIQEYLAAMALYDREDCEKVFCRAYFNPTLAEMEVLPMTLGLVRKPDDLYTALEQLPESLTFTSLRLRARGLAYVQKISQEHQTKLADWLIDLIFGRNIDESAYADPILDSLSTASSQSLKLIVDRISSLLKKDGDSFVRVRAAWALREIGSLEAVPALLQALKDEDSVVRGFAAAALGQIGSEAAVPALLQALSDEDSFVQWFAAAALGQIGDETLTLGLLRALAPEEAFVRRKAVEVVGYYASNEQALKELLRLATTDPLDEVRNAASEALDQFYRKLQYLSEEAGP